MQATREVENGGADVDAWSGAMKFGEKSGNEEENEAANEVVLIVHTSSSRVL